VSGERAVAGRRTASPGAWSLPRPWRADPVVRPAPPRRRGPLGRPGLVGLVALALLGATGGVPLYRAQHVQLPLLTQAVAVRGDGLRVALAPGASVYPGTRVLRDDGPDAQRRAAAQHAWLAAGTIPAPVRHRGLVAAALLDLDTLTLPGGALVAGWPPAWRYVWPRDASFAAAALAAAGHPTDAVTILGFLQAVQPDSGVFQARYLPDGSGPPDGRGEQTDGTGLVLWAVEQVVRNAADGAAVLEHLRPLVDRSTDAALRLTSSRGVLPPPSQDYWEVRDHRLSLGTAAPLAAGLAAAARLYAVLGLHARAALAAARARALYAAVDAAFGPDGYPRYLGDFRPDASVAFLLPPFRPDGGPAAVPAARAAVLAAWHRAAQAMRRPAGGLAPGAAWKDDGVSWTPETALFALTAAATGQPGLAGSWLDWLGGHATVHGALPEKVTSDGSPAGPAPLALTDALVVLAAAQLPPA
jgi:glucoamylase